MYNVKLQLIRNEIVTRFVLSSALPSIIIGNIEFYILIHSALKCYCANIHENSQLGEDYEIWD